MKCVAGSRFSHTRFIRILSSASQQLIYCILTLNLETLHLISLYNAVCPIFFLAFVLGWVLINHLSCSVFYFIRTFSVKYPLSIFILWRYGSFIIFQCF